MKIKKLVYTITILTSSLPLHTQNAPLAGAKSAKLPLPTYTVHPFNLGERLIDLTDKQISEHEMLYKGYVDKRNQIAQSLETVDRSTANNRTYSPYRSLKLAETFAMNGDILHRLYFRNLASNPTKIGQRTRELIVQSFGSVEQFKKDLIDAAQVSNGWAVTAYSLDDHRLHNYVLETHNFTVPIMVIPVLVLDVYEHAYWMDYGTKRLEYLRTFWESIDWDVVEERIQAWVNPFEQIDLNAQPAAHRKKKQQRTKNQQ